MLLQYYNDRCKLLEAKFDGMDEILVNNHAKFVVEERRNLKEQIDMLYANNSKAYQIGAIAKWVEGEKALNYF